MKLKEIIKPVFTAVTSPASRQPKNRNRIRILEKTWSLAKKENGVPTTFRSFTAAFPHKLLALSMRKTILNL